MNARSLGLIFTLILFALIVAHALGLIGLAACVGLAWIALSLAAGCAWCAFHARVRPVPVYSRRYPRGWRVVGTDTI